jgi:hypothetical protein
MNLLTTQIFKKKIYFTGKLGLKSHSQRHSFIPSISRIIEVICMITSIEVQTSLRL